MTDFDRLVDDALARLWQTDPVAASFAGERDYDSRLPEAGASAIADERAALAALGERLQTTAVPPSLEARIDARYVRTYVEQTGAELTHRPRTHNPAWYTGEAAFGLIALLSRERDERDDDALAARLAAIPDFFGAARSNLSGRDIPRAWVARAAGEADAIVRLLRSGLPLHPWAEPDGRQVERAVFAVERFKATLTSHADADPACGRDALAALMRRVHGLRESPAELEARATRAYDEALARLEESAAALDRDRSWREQLASLAAVVPAPESTLDEFARWHARALADARELVTSAGAYELSFEAVPPWAAAVAAELYFLWYRSPAARHPGRGSRYYVDGEPSVSTIKLVHAVHHGSIGHHTQNAYARGADSRFARIAGTDGASALTLLSAGTMVEGWACYAEDLLLEVPDFYSASERLQCEYFTLRNIACCLADVRMHAGTWSVEDVRRFYRDDVGFTPSRVVAETTRNSMFPGSRLMYWVGSTEIAAMRARSPLATRAFHDALLTHGSVPLAWLRDELAA